VEKRRKKSKIKLGKQNKPINKVKKEKKKNMKNYWCVSSAWLL